MNNLNQLYNRNKLIWGNYNQELLATKHIMIFGLGGVGSYSAEAIARAGIGKISLIDFDKIELSNFNRQLLATMDNVGLFKTDLMEKRINSINPDIKIFKQKIYYNRDFNKELFKNKPDYIIDAIDSVNSKLDLIEYCYVNKINIISSMGTGNRLDPTALYVTDISKTSNCPLARKIRHKLKAIGILSGVTVLSSKESPINPDYTHFDQDLNKNHPPGSIPFVPPVAGYILASYVIRSIIRL